MARSETEKQRAAEARRLKNRIMSAASPVIDRSIEPAAFSRRCLHLAKYMKRNAQKKVTREWFEGFLTSNGLKPSSEIVDRLVAVKILELTDDGMVDFLVSPFVYAATAPKAEAAPKPKAAKPLPHEAQTTDIRKHLLAYLRQASRPLPCDTSRQRSYRALGDDHALDRISPSVISDIEPKLNIRRLPSSPSRMFSLSCKSLDGDVLIVENQDPLLEISSLMRETRCRCLFGHKFAHILWSEGGSNVKPGVIDSQLAYLGYAERKVWYLGDIDRAGIRELDLIMSNNKADISPLIEGYAAMLRVRRCLASQGFEELKAGRHQVCFDSGQRVLPLFPPRDARAIQAILDEGAIVPQEILTRTEYLAAMGPIAVARGLRLHL